MQIALVDAQRRVQSRLALPWIDVDSGWSNREQAEGRPLLRPQGTERRLDRVPAAFRQASDILAASTRSRTATTADADARARYRRLESLVTAWYASSPGQERIGDPKGSRRPFDESAEPALLDEVLTLAMRPSLARAAEVMSQRLDLSGWRAPYCPFCGGEPDLAFITPAADRRLVCGRCARPMGIRWLACPFCSNADDPASPRLRHADGQYRMYAAMSAAGTSRRTTGDSRRGLSCRSSTRSPRSARRGSDAEGYR